MGVPEASSYSGHTGKTYGVTQPGRRWLAKLRRPSHHWASQRPTLYRVLCEALGQGGERAPAPSLVHIRGGAPGSQFSGPQSSQKALGVKGAKPNKLIINHNATYYLY